MKKKLMLFLIIFVILFQTPIKSEAAYVGWEANFRNNLRADYNEFATKTFMELVRSSNGESLVYSPLSYFIPLYSLSELSDKHSVLDKELHGLIGERYYEKRHLVGLIEELKSSNNLVNSSLWIPDGTGVNLNVLKKNLIGSAYPLNSAGETLDERKKNWLKVNSNHTINTDKLSLKKANSNKEIHALGITQLNLDWYGDYFKIEKKDFNGKGEMNFLTSKKTLTLEYLNQRDFEMVKVPLKKMQTLVLIKPKDGYNLDSILRKNLMKFASTYDVLVQTDIDLSFPQIKQETQLEISKKSLSAKTNSFQNGLNLKEINIAAIEQATSFELNENKQGETYFDSIPILKSSKKIQLSFDKPFIYFVVDNNNLILMGIYQ